MSERLIFNFNDRTVTRVESKPTSIETDQQTTPTLSMSGTARVQTA